MCIYIYINSRKIKRNIALNSYGEKITMERFLFPLSLENRLSAMLVVLKFQAEQPRI
jgi:hypothetical protein